MCNACGFYCCASDMFGKCGCEYCPDSDCWDDDWEDGPDAGDEYPDLEFTPRACCVRPARVRCEAVG